MARNAPWLIDLIEKVGESQWFKIESLDRSCLLELGVGFWLVRNEMGPLRSIFGCDVTTEGATFEQNETVVILFHVSSVRGENSWVHIYYALYMVSGQIFEQRDQHPTMLRL